MPRLSTAYARSLGMEILDALRQLELGNVTATTAADVLEAAASTLRVSRPAVVVARNRVDPLEAARAERLLRWEREQLGVTP